VVESSLGVPTIVRGSCNGKTAEMFSEVVMAEPWDSVGTTETVGIHKAQEGGF
jgi:hypothetical protein